MIIKGTQEVQFIGLVSMTKDNTFDGKPFGVDNFTGGPFVKGRLSKSHFFRIKGSFFRQRWHL